MSTKKENYILNPIAAITDTWQPIVAFGILIFSICLSYFTGVAHDGITHGTYIAHQSWFFLLCTNISVVLLPAFLLFVTGKYFNSQTRFTDMWNTILFSRLPLLIYYGIFFTVIDKKLLEKMMSGKFSPTNTSAGDITTLSVIGLLGLPFLIYSIIILVNGYKTSMYAKKPLHYVAMVVAVIVAEIIYRLMLFPLFIKL